MRRDTHRPTRAEIRNRRVAEERRENLETLAEALIMLSPLVGMWLFMRLFSALYLAGVITW